MTNKIIPIFTTLLLVSCIQNPEAELQNQKINDLREKNEYLNKKIDDQNQKLNDLVDKIKELSLKIDLKPKNSNLRANQNKIQKKYPDSLNVNIKFSQK